MPLLNSLATHSRVSISVGKVQEPGLRAFIFLESAAAISMLDLDSCSGFTDCSLMDIQ